MGDYLSSSGFRIEVEADKKKIWEIIDKVVNGEWGLYIPAFQRDFVWDEDDIKDFFDSILRGYPVGSVILWRHASYDPENDSFAESLISGIEMYEGAEKYYILDGQQRLTAIMLLRFGWCINRSNRQIKLGVPIAFRPADCKLVKSRKIGIDLSKLVRSYAEGDISRIVANYPGYKQLLKNVAAKILRYEIPIYYLTTYGDFSRAVMEMAQAFVRVNREGVRIGGVELQISLLTGHIGGDFSRLVKENYLPLRDKYSLDLVPFLRFIISNLGLKQTDISRVARESPESFRKRLERAGVLSKQPSRFNEVFNKSSKAMRLTLELLKSELGLMNTSLLPSQLTLIPIATYLYYKGVNSIKSLNTEETENIINWLIIVNFRGRYTSRTDTKLQRDINIVKGTKEFPLNELLNEIRSPKITLSDLMRGNNINVLRKAGQPYLFLLYAVLVKEEADDWTGALIRSRNLDELAKHHIFPREYLEESNIVPDEPREKEGFISGLGNITFINKQLNAEIGASPPCEYLYDYEKSIEKHFIPSDTSLWKLNKFEQFKEERVRKIYEALKRHFPLAFS
ncbi:MAG: hypothetical protein DRN53_00035 [Thermoprotei archaeon]|nr:MAG: hypothetical protein DRN53_00035 [Thermoprotei archaeon]